MIDIGITTKEFKNDPDFEFPKNLNFKIIFNILPSPLLEVTFGKMCYRYFSMKSDFIDCLILPNGWLLRLSEYFYYIFEKNNKLEMLFFNRFDQTYISEKGIYYWKNNTFVINFFSFEQRQNFSFTLFLTFNDIRFYKSYILLKGENFFYVHVNEYDIPEGVDIDLLKYHYTPPPEPENGNEKILVCFSDTEKEYTKSELHSLESIFIDEQLSSSNEIHLDIKIEDFTDENYSAMKYIMSNRTAENYGNELIDKL